MHQNPTQNPPEAQALDVRQAAKVLGLSASTLCQRRVRGLPPRYIKMGARVTYRMQDLMDFQEDCIRQSTSGD